jgi:hypothetical protein
MKIKKSQLAQLIETAIVEVLREVERETPQQARIRSGTAGAQGAKKLGVPRGNRELRYQLGRNVFPSKKWSDAQEQKPVREMANPGAPPTGTPIEEDSGMGDVVKFNARTREEDKRRTGSERAQADRKQATTTPTTFEEGKIQRSRKPKKK